MKRIGIIIAGGLTILGLGGCAVYQPLALVDSPKLASSLDQLETHLDGAAFQELPASWKQYPIIVADGLDETETVLLALLNSPRLNAARSQMAEARATLYAAGLLPDPQASVGLDVPRSKDPALQTGASFGLGIDLQKIITRGARRDAAAAQAEATYLNVLWQEWQVIQQARILWRRAFIQKQQLVILQDQLQQAISTWSGIHDALAQGNATLDQDGLALAPMMDAQVAVQESKRLVNTTNHDIHLLLGVDPSAPVLLSGVVNMESLVSRQVDSDLLQAALKSIAQHRPDLLALQAGYRSQENRVREQILMQFPSFSIGANSLRDTAGLWTLGPFINLSLPMFDANRGNVAMARATRERLYEEYSNQLISASVEASKIIHDQQLARSEWQVLTARLPQLAKTVDRMAHALSSGQIDMLTFTTLRTAYFSQQARALGLEQVLLEQSVALDTLTGLLLSDGATISESEYSPSDIQATQELHP